MYFDYVVVCVRNVSASALDSLECVVIDHICGLSLVTVVVD